CPLWFRADGRYSSAATHLPCGYQYRVEPSGGYRTDADSFENPFELAIPRELPQDAARETVLAFVRENFVSQGMIADVAFHHMDKTNPHAHIMLTTRAVGPAGFGGKVRDWNDRTHAETWRASWADHANRALTNAG
ncbi:MobA/MobL family protein, partial [Escherichia coli]|nr:MobA/MobL family protein [Escherichia coli]